MNVNPRGTPTATTDASETPAPRRAPLAALFRTGTVRLRAAAVTRSVEEGRSAYWRFNTDAFDALAAQLLTAAAQADATTPPSVARDDPWSLLGPLADAWWASTADQTPTERWRAAADLAWLLAWMDSQAADSWTYNDPGIDRLALPVERQANADLFAMLDRFTAPDAGAAPPAGTAPSTDELAMAPSGAETPPPAPAPAPPPSPPTAKARWRGRQAVAVATLRAFEAGVFSSRRDEPCRADARALQQLDAVALKAAFRAASAQPLPGLDARAEGLAAWGRALAERASRGGSDRLSSWAEPWLNAAATPGAAPQLAAAAAAFLALGATRSPRVLGQTAGDAWPHLWAGASAQPEPDDAPVADKRPTAVVSPFFEHPGTGGYAAFHRTAQQVVRTAAHPWAWARAAGAPLPALTALDALVDHSGAADIGAVLRAGVLVARHSGDLYAAQALDSAWVVEARAVALTVVERLVERAATSSDDRPAALARVASVLSAGAAAGAASLSTATPTPIVRYDTGLW